MTHPMMLEGAQVSHAPQLVSAIQSCIPGRVRAVIEQLKLLADDEVKDLKGSARPWARKNYVNDRLSGSLDLTALHLAAKAYSAHHKDRNLASVFNEMVGDLLAAGADPWLEVGAKSVPCRGLGVNNIAGQTVVEVCEGNVPPALTAWIIEQNESHACLHGFSALRHEATLKRRAAKTYAWRERNGRNKTGQELDGPTDEELEQELQFA